MKSSQVDPCWPYDETSGVGKLCICVLLLYLEPLWKITFTNKFSSWLFNKQKVIHDRFLSMRCIWLLSKYIVIVFTEWKHWRQKHSAKKRLTELLEWVLIKLRRHLTQTCLRWILIHHQERHPHHRLLIVNQVQVRHLIHDRKSFLCAGNNRAVSILFFYYYLVLIIIFFDEASEAFL